MKKLTLKQIRLRDWRSLNIDVTFNEKSTTIHAKNRVGKSSLFHAWCWLLSGYTDCNNVRNFNLFDEKRELTKDTPEASVRAVVDIDGVEYTFERRAKATFKRERGSSEYTKSSSDTYTTLIDDIEVSASHWKEFISANVCDSDMITYVLSGDFLSTLTIEDKNSAREVMMKIVGDIKDDDYTDDYSCIADGLAKGYSLEQIEEQAKNRKKELEKEISSLPKIIESKQLLVSEYAATDYATISKEIEVKRIRIKDIDTELTDASKRIQSLMEQHHEHISNIRDINTRIDEERNEHDNKHFDKIRKIKKEIEDVKERNERTEKQNAIARQTHAQNKTLLRDTQNDVVSIEMSLEALRKQRNEIKSRVFVEESCPVCGSAFSIERVNEMRENFYKKQKEDLQECVREGKEKKSRLEASKTLVEELKEKISRGEECVALEDVSLLEKELNETNNNYVEFNNTEIYKELITQRDTIVKKLNDISDEGDKNTKLQDEKSHLIDDIQTLSQKLGLKQECERLEKEIEEHRESHRMLGVRIAHEEMIIDAVKRKREERALIISKRINERLNGVYVEMFRRLKDGSQTPDCIIRGQGGVQYATINNSAKTLINIELQRLMMRSLDITMPIWVDECKNFDDENMPTGEEQMIYLYASNSPRIIVE